MAISFIGLSHGLNADLERGNGTIDVDNSNTEGIGL